ncbi:AAA family ATPase [Sphaerisporangium rubeum]|uniref:Class 3 adenylate cyclase/tetratricopeptide (TPR) repeat protein n=1 Tax=Sphaerisporangium rubeum TaxID=321317 RepID=A0A7X0IDW9_9ACTN|nr:adenylate/guanylate cyclase domain-containing protein [Sphaerisporangium rubeum]MBB6473153.1 class 3 adenylate cyclase/tetratricopeptide (TPR) repeat protein [Sphaerisporangium rubeum]
MNAGPARRHVVVVFIDLVGSTEMAERLDPELLRHILDRYYRVCTTAIAEHGGVVEKFIGDAIMATFGIPVSSEDDALRAARAAHAAMAGVHLLSDELAPTHGIRLDVHCGISAGEAIVIVSPGSDLRVIGDTVNTAARLQSAAGDGEILLGDEVARMVRAEATVEPVPPLTLKGKSAPVRAWRLLSLEPYGRRPDDDQIPLVGREDEMEQLLQAYRRATQGRRCCVVTLLGVPGIGKSRLVRDFTGALPGEVTVVTGRCLSYGAGITYRPVAEMLESLHWPSAVPAPESAGSNALRGLTGASGGGGEGAGVEEISSAVRSLFETLAAERPLVAVWEDLHWAEPTLLELIEDLATWLLDVPVLLVCVARPDLLDARPTWGGGMACAASLELGPLGVMEMGRLVAELTAAQAGDVEVMAHGADPPWQRIADSADGNPLFAELMLEMLLEEGEDAPLPPTIQALLGARLDRLGDGERDVLERAATIGHAFTVEEMRLLFQDAAADRPRLDDLLRRLLRNRMIRRGETPGAYQFTQTLTRDTVYAMTRKELRATWHLALADRLAERTERTRAQRAGEFSFEDSAQGDLAHHLETACLLRREVRPDDPGLPVLTGRAAHALIGAGTQALHRKDLPAALALLERGRTLLPAGDPGHRELAVRICDAGLAYGDGDRASAALHAAQDMLPDDPRNLLTCAIGHETLAVRFGARTPDLGPLSELLLADPGDDLSWCRFHQLEALVHLGEGCFAGAEDALREGLTRARALGDRYEESRLLSGLCELAQWSSTPVADGLALCEDLTERFAGDRALLVPVLVTKGRLLALSGEVDAAREVLRTAGRHAEDLHLELAGTAVVQVGGLVESLAGWHAEAERLFRQGAASLRATGQTGPATTLETYAARELLRQGRVEEAAAELDALEADAARLQSRGELTRLVLRARVLSHRGDHRAAVALTAQAERLLERTDDPCLRGDVLVEISDICREAGLLAESVTAARRALRHYTDKGATLPAARARERLTAFGSPTEEGTRDRASLAP